MKVINRHILLQYMDKNPDCRNSLQTWFHLARYASWSSPQELRRDYPDASFITMDWVSLPLKTAHCRIVMQVSLLHGFMILRHITPLAGRGQQGGL